jgi:hypothetical protein
MEASMFTRLALAVLIVAAGPSLVAAQSSTSFTTKPLPAPPMKSAPTSGQTVPGQSKSLPPAARSGEKGLRIGNDAVTGDLLEIKRIK